MSLLIFKTDIRTKKNVRIVQSILRNVISASEFNVDLQDIDSVLRIETTKRLKEKEIILLLNKEGFYCETL